MLIQLLIALLGYVLRVFLSRELGKELFGEFTFALALGTWASLFIQGGLEKTLVREFILDKPCRPVTFTSSLVLKTALLLPATLFIVCILSKAFIDSLIFQGLLALALAAALRAFNTQAVYDSEKQQTTFSFISLGERVVLLLTVLLACIFQNTISCFILGYIYLLVMVANLTAQFALSPFSPAIVSYQCISNSLKKLFQHSWLIWLATLSGAAVEYSSPLLLRYFSGPRDVAEFGVCWLLVTLLLLTQGQLARLGYVRLLEACKISSVETYRVWKKYSFWMLLLGLLVSLPGLAFPVRLLSLFGTEYESASQILRILSLYPIIFGPFLASLQYMLTLNWNRAYLVINLLTGVSSLLGHVLITREYASSGAATVSVLSLFIGLSAVTTLIYVYRPNDKTVSKLMI